MLKVITDKKLLSEIGNAERVGSKDTARFLGIVNRPESNSHSRVVYSNQVRSLAFRVSGNKNSLASNCIQTYFRYQSSTYLLELSVLVFHSLILVAITSLKLSSLVLARFQDGLYIYISYFMMPSLFLKIIPMTRLTLVTEVSKEETFCFCPCTNPNWFSDCNTIQTFDVINAQGCSKSSFRFTLNKDYLKYIRMMQCSVYTCINTGRRSRSRYSRASRLNSRKNSVWESTRGSIIAVTCFNVICFHIPFRNLSCG